VIELSRRRARSSPRATRLARDNAPDVAMKGDTVVLRVEPQDMKAALLRSAAKCAARW